MKWETEKAGLEESKNDAQKKYNDLNEQVYCFFVSILVILYLVLSTLRCYRTNVLMCTPHFTFSFSILANKKCAPHFNALNS